MPPGQRIILVAAGAGAGIAATFNTPIGGVMFAIELMMPEVSVPHLPAGRARDRHGDLHRPLLLRHRSRPSRSRRWRRSSADATSALTLCLYALLGAITGVAAAGFVRGLHLLEDLFDKIKERYTRHMLGMLLVGVLMYVLHAALRPLLRRGRRLRDGRRRSCSARLSAAGLLAPAVRLQAAGDLAQPRLGLVGRHLLAVAVHGRDDRRRLRRGARSRCICRSPINVPSFAMVGMGAMVGGGTGAVMTAVTMIFEMTRDYDIVLPMIVAVALSVGVRRLLSRENIYTLEAVPPRPRHSEGAARQHVPGAPRQGGDGHGRGPGRRPRRASMSFSRQPDHARPHAPCRRHRGRRIVGVLRVNTGAAAQASEGARSGVTLGDVASRNFTVVREDDIVFDVIQRIWRQATR